MPPPGGQAPAPAPGQASQPAQPPRPIPQYNTVPGMAQQGQPPPSAPPRMAPPGGQPTPAPQPSQPQQGPMPPPGSPQATEQMKRQNWLKQNLQGKGYTPAQIQAALGSPEAKAAMTQQREDEKFAMEVRKEEFSNAEKAVSDRLAERTANREDLARKDAEKAQGETARHNRSEEGISRANTGQAAASLKETIRYHDAEIKKMEKVGTEKEMPATMKKSVQLDIAESRQALEALAGLKSTTGSPFFSMEKPGMISGILGRAATPVDMQKYDVYANRLAVAIASIQSMGRGQVSDSKVREARKLVPALGEDPETSKVKLAQIKKITDMADNVLQGKNPESESGAQLKTEAPKVGTVVDGHTFKGGDPSKESNWEVKKKLADTEPNPNDPSWKREGGELKGKGFLGLLPHKGNKVSTEISIGVPINGKEMDIPSLVPTLSKDQIQWLLDGKKPTREIVAKASDFAKKRIKEGKSVFANHKDGDY